MTPVPIVLPDSHEMPRRRWTRDECKTLTDLGLLEPGRYELLEGEIVLKMGQGRVHIFVVTQPLRILGEIFGPNSLQSQADLQPTPTGYANISSVPDTGVVAPLAAPGAVIRVADLFPQPAPLFCPNIYLFSQTRLGTI